MGTVLHQRHEADLRICARAAAGPGTTERFFIALLVGDIQGTAINADQTPSPKPCTLRRRHGDRLHQFIV